MIRLYLDSSKATNHRFNLDEKINGKWKFLSFTATNNIFNVTETNNKIYISELPGIHDDPNSYTATLTIGNYDITDLKTEIQTAVNNVIEGTFTVTLDENTNKFEFTSTTQFNFEFGTYTTNSARKLLGMNTTDKTESYTHTSDVPVDINTYRDIFINISQNDDRNVVGTEFFNTSIIINGYGNFGEVLRYVNVDNFDQFVKFRNTKSIDVRIHDLNNNVVNLNSDYSIILEKN